MIPAVRNRLLAIGVLWGILLAAVPAFVMMPRPYRLSGFLVAALACAALSGAVGTLAAGGWSARKKGGGGRRLLGVFAIGSVQGLVGGAVAALLIWGLMAVTLSGFTLENPVDLATLMSPRVFLGSFFVSLSVFVYALVGGMVLAPAFGTLINRSVRVEEGS